ncbi:PTPA-CTERM sorting domain-containing protein [Thermoleptolyngbya sp. M55_K2018_002]|uniref:PTPA-CTERM sorting domain-containing protein n=1 Tax=Thermoleptolyngbya sp. M55_K2018_002 TaxID=2747808 RepID=UPI001A09F411|nr:PTPA-CTERM sorting domain-containing protein [Thermoleptolyngbya sp. M55_K2018_002]HIK41707.1 PTPA-CTERM sorting domain-containing protein [Thermoleptolyngbya sp. M55_K2018_002]
MNLRHLGFQTLLLGTAITASVVASAPAQAVALFGSIGLTGSSTVNPNGVTFLTDTVNIANSDFSGLLNSNTAILKPLVFTPPLGTNPAAGTYSSRGVAALTSFIDFGTVTIGATTATLTFDLDEVSNAVTTIVKSPVFGISHNINPLTGKFNFNGQTIAAGFLQASVSGSGANAASTYQITLSTQPIPTPALLPGLMAMGAAALRKRREAEEETLDAEV